MPGRSARCSPSNMDCSIASSSNYNDRCSEYASCRCGTSFADFPNWCEKWRPTSENRSASPPGATPPRHGSPNLPGGLVFPEALIDHLSEQAVLRPRQKLDLDDKLWSDPMDPREDERRSEPAGPRGRRLEGHLLDGERLEPMPQPFEFGVRDSRPDPSRIDQFAVRRVVAEQQRAEPMPAALGIGPANRDKFLAVQEKPHEHRHAENRRCSGRRAQRQMGCREIWRPR